ncbi:MAG: acyltransferase domain-containing protein, partial [Candidatus Latescibacterota bacterium]
MNTAYKPHVLVFSGIGTQWPGMGEDIFATEPAFLVGTDEFDDAFSALSGWSPVEMIRSGSDVSEASKGHPCVMLLEIGLYSLLRDRGIEPSAIIGHSGGEVAAAVASGALTIADAALVTWRHSCILEQLAGRGAMAHISLSSKDVKPYLAGIPDVTIAAKNSPFATVIAGPEESLRLILDAISTKTDVFCRMLRVDAPLHSRFVEPFLDEFECSLSGVRPLKPSVPIYSTLHGRLAGKDDFNASYWRNHIYRPVAFMEAVMAALSDGADCFIEIAPHAVLQDALIDCARAAGKTIKSSVLMIRNEPAMPLISNAIAALKAQDDAAYGITAAKPSTDNLHSLREIEPKRRAALIMDIIKDCLISVSGSEIIPSDTGEFVAMGVTSLLAVRLRNALTDRLGIDMPATIVFNYPTIPLLANHLLEQLDLGVAAEPVAGSGSTGHLREPLAIVGLSCRLPGGAHDPDAFWELLKGNVDAVCTIPPDRWDKDRFYDPDPSVPGMSNTCEGGFLTCPIDRFDAPFFNISAREARQLDPQQRLLLEVVWEAFENANIDITALHGSRTGVFLGMSSSDYSHSNRDSYRRELIDAYTLTGSTFSAA